MDASLRFRSNLERSPNVRVINVAHPPQTTENWTAFTITARTVDHVPRVLHGTLARAVDCGLVQQNVAIRVRPPCVPDQEVGADQAHAVLRTAKGKPEYRIATWPPRRWHSGGNAPFPRRDGLAKCLSSNDGRVAEWFKAPVLKYDGVRFDRYPFVIPCRFL
jgi:hypothetical protein